MRLGWVLRGGLRGREPKSTCLASLFSGCIVALLLERDSGRSGAGSSPKNSGKASIVFWAPRRDPRRGARSKWTPRGRRCNYRSFTRHQQELHCGEQWRGHLPATRSPARRIRHQRNRRWLRCESACRRRTGRRRGSTGECSPGAGSGGTDQSAAGTFAQSSRHPRCAADGYLREQRLPWLEIAATTGDS